MWMQPLAAARAGVESPVGGAKADLVALALAAAAAARRAAEQGAVLLKDHWQQEGGLQVGVSMQFAQWCIKASSEPPDTRLSLDSCVVSAACYSIHEVRLPCTGRRADGCAAGGCSCRGSG